MNTLAVSPDPKRLAEIQSAVANIELLGTLQTHHGSLESEQTLPGKGTPDVLLLDCTTHAIAELSALERIAPQFPQLNTILIVAEDSAEILLRALRIGVREVVKVPLAAEDFSSAARRIVQMRQGPERQRARVIAFISCKGGSGATFIATNVGFALAATHAKSVALIDLNLQFGDAALFVSDRKPPATVVDVARDIHRVDAAFLRSSMIEVLPNYGILAAPEDPTEASTVRASSIESLVRHVQSMCDVVILDVGRALDSVTIQALDLADDIFPVFQLTMPFIRDGRRLVSLFHSLGYPKDKIRPLVNRYDRNDELRIEDLEAAIGSKVYATIPNHYRSVAASVNQGVPILKLSRGSPVTRSLNEFGEMLIRPPGAATGGWLSRMLGRN